MTQVEITAKKEQLAILKAQVAQIEKDIQRAELDSQIRDLENRKMENFHTMQGIIKANLQGDALEAAIKVINTLKLQNERLEKEWQEVYSVYFNL